MKVFLSHSSKDKDIAEKIFLALIEFGHEVFYDKDRLLAGQAYNKRIENEVYKSDLFIFLISPNSIKSKSYTLTEIKYAQKKWKHPGNNVLPVMIESTNYTKIPNYIAAVTIFTPVGNVAAEVASEVNSFNEKLNRVKINIKAIVAFIIAITVAVVVIYDPYSFINNSTLKPTSRILASDNVSTDDLNSYIDIKSSEYQEIKNVDEKCIIDYKKRNINESVKSIELGARDLTVLFDGNKKKKQIALLLNEDANLLATIVFNVFPDNKIFKIDSIVDTNCSEIRSYFNNSRGGDKHVLQDWDTLGIDINGKKYFLRLGYARGGVAINRFYKEQ